MFFPLNLVGLGLLFIGVTEFVDICTDHFWGLFGKPGLWTSSNIKHSLLVGSQENKVQYEQFSIYIMFGIRILFKPLYVNLSLHLISLCEFALLLASASTKPTHTT